MRAFLNRWHKQDVVAIRHDEHHLSRISSLVRVDNDVLKSAFFNRKNDFLKRNIAFSLQAFVLGRVPSERLHADILTRRVPFVISERRRMGLEIDLGCPLRFSETPIKHEVSPPALGQHTDEILRGVLKMNDAEIAKLRAEGVV